MTDPNPAENPAGDGVVINEDRAKQGRVGSQMLIVLAISLVLVLAAFVALYGMNAHRTNDSTPQAARQNAIEASRGTS